MVPLREVVFEYGGVRRPEKMARNMHTRAWIRRIVQECADSGRVIIPPSDSVLLLSRADIASFPVAFGQLRAMVNDIISGKRSRFSAPPPDARPPRAAGSNKRPDPRRESVSSDDEFPHAKRARH